IGHAAITNTEILSAEERQRCKVLLSNAEVALFGLDRIIAGFLAQRKSQEVRILKYRTALAPHKRLPVEVLGEIFAYFIPDLPSQPCRADAYATHAAWILGQVCSLWRQISRNDPKLWSTVSLDISKSSVRLRELIPSVVTRFVDLRYNVFDSYRVSSSPPSPSSTSNIISVFHGVQNVNLCLYSHQLDTLWQNVDAHPGAFSTLEELAIFVKPSTSDYTPCLAEIKPFRQACNLQRLTIDYSRSEYGSLLLSLDIPWQQITSLNIRNVVGLRADTILRHLAQCTALEVLAVTFTDPADDGDTALISRVFRSLQRLRSIELRTHNLNETVDIAAVNNSHLAILHVMEMDVCTRLVRLDLRYAGIHDATVIYTVLQRCIHLVAFSSNVPRDFSRPVTIARDISLLQLKTLRVRHVEDPWIFQCILAPSLTCLDTSADEDCGAISAIHHMIVSSGCSLHEFSYSWPRGMYTRHPAGVCELLREIPTVRRVQITNVLISTDIFELFAQGVLLPHVEKLTFSVAVSMQLVRWLETRMEWELRCHGQRKLREFTRKDLRGEVEDDADALVHWTDLAKRYKLKSTCEY
ncbi:hypothetical protein DXG03_009262, partial [Asterophora parasitica]